jgi:pectinesterase
MSNSFQILSFKGKRGIFLLIVLFLILLNSIGNVSYDILVAKDGSGQFTSVSEAIESLPMYNYERVVIFIKNGSYNEKLLINRDYITLLGESRDSTLIEFSSLRTDWLANPDFIGPAVINIAADDIILKNISVKNTQPEIGPHAFAIYGTGTRTILINCSVISNGGDTLSLWNYKQGMYYHSNCYFEGSVDMVCPRGWCYIRDSKFYELKETAAIWHAAVTNPNQKLVIVNSTFDGTKGFNLARHHYDAQFFLMNCTFSENMSDKPIEHVVPKDSLSPRRPYFYGDRYYFYNCHSTSKDRNWFSNNPEKWPDGFTPDSVSALKTFDYQWDPENSSPLKIKNIQVKDNQLFLYFDELVGVRGKPIIKDKSGKIYNYFIGSGRDELQFIAESSKQDQKFKENENLNLLNGDIYSIKASVEERKVPTVFKKES